MPHEAVPLSDESIRRDEEYVRLEVEHHEYESRLSKLAEKAALSADEQLEQTTLKKKKLQIKDRMQAIARRHRDT
jgi:hypothetical protein